MSDPTTFSRKLEDFGAAYLQLLQLVAESEECQWQAGHTTPPMEDTTERARGMVSDPTANIVADARRLHLREAVTRSQTALLIGQAQMTAARRLLEASLNSWQGGKGK